MTPKLSLSLALAAFGVALATAQSAQEHSLRLYRVPKYTSPEACFKVLKDDKASVDDWVLAAQALNTPTVSVPTYEGTLVVKLGTGGRPYGESLRTASKPTVSEVLRDRVRQMAKKPDANGTDRLRGLTLAATVAIEFCKWDPQASIPVLNELEKKAVKAFVEDPNAAYSVRLTSVLGLVETQRIGFGVESATKDYARWVKLVPFATLRSGGYSDTYTPIATFQSNAELVSLGQELFASEKSATYLPTITKQFPDLLRTLHRESMLKIRGVRDGLQLVLKDTEIVGEYWMQTTQEIRCEVKGSSGSYSRSPNKIEIERADPNHLNEKVPLRLNEYAVLLFTLDRSDLPRFAPYLSMETREELFKRYALFLERAYLDEDGWGPSAS